MPTLACPRLHGDFSCLARLLLTFGASHRKAVADRICENARIAKQHVQTYGTAHDLHGNGSVMSAVRRYAGDHPRHALPPEPTFNDPEYINCCIHALQAFRELAKAEKMAGQELGGEGEALARGLMADMEEAAARESEPMVRAAE